LYQQKRWFVVLGYGCDPHGKRIKEYLKFVTEIVNPSDQKNVIITCGGFTNPRDFPEISEAGMMEKVLRDEIKYKCLILKEEKSFTTLENLRNAFRLIKENIGPYPWQGDIVIICDRMRSFKVSYLATRIFSLQCPIHIIGFDSERNKKDIIKHGILGTIKDILSYHFPFLEQYFLNKRKKKWGIIS